MPNEYFEGPSCLCVPGGGIFARQCLNLLGWMRSVSGERFTDPSSIISGQPLFGVRTGERVFVALFCLMSTRPFAATALTCWRTQSPSSIAPNQFYVFPGAVSVLLIVLSDISIIHLVLIHAQLLDLQSGELLVFVCLCLANFRLKFGRCGVRKLPYSFLAPCSNA